MTLTTDAVGVAETAPTPLPAQAPGRPRSRAAIFRHYVTRSWVMSLRDWEFLLFIITLPVVMYLFFAGIYGDQEVRGGVKVMAVMMVTMAAYGGLGAALASGAQIQTERASGWFRQLMISGLGPVEFFTAKIIVAVGITVPAIGMVFAAGAVRGVRLDADIWLAAGGLLLAALMPMVVFGLVLGLWLKPQAAQAATTMVMLALSMVGGLWFPLDMMPTWMQAIGKTLPSYWAGQIGVWPILQGDFPWQGVGVIAAWTVGLTLLGFLGYQRSVRTSRR